MVRENGDIYRGFCLLWSSVIVQDIHNFPPLRETTRKMQQKGEGGGRVKAIHFERNRGTQ